MSEFLTEWESSWLVRTTIEGSILIGLVLLVIGVLGRNLGPRWRIALWVLVGVKLLVPASISFVPGFGSRINSGEVVPKTFVWSSIEQTAVESSDVPELAEAVLAQDPVPNNSRIAWWGLGIWTTGAVGFLGVLFWRQYCFIKKTGNRRCHDRSILSLVDEFSDNVRLQRKVKVILTTSGSTPAVLGVFQPRLLLPEDWNVRFRESELRHILIHELEHVRFGDLMWNWIAAFINALHWFNPLVWLAASRFQADRELRCDADTLARLHPGERINYGKTLLTVQQKFHTAPAVAGLAPCVRKYPALHQRITMITKPTASRRWLNITFTLALLGLIGLSFGAATADDKERGPAREGARDGERRGGEGEKEGDRPREGEREGDQPRGEGEREGDRPREGEREGDRSRRGARDGEGEAVRDGELKISVLADGIIIGDKKIALINLRRALEGRTESSAVLYASSGVPTQNIKTVVNALSDSGINKVRFSSLERGAARREGDPPREGSRDGERPGEGARDGETRREGPRDGEMRREGPRDGETRREGPREGEGEGGREGSREGEAKRGGARDRDEDMDARQLNMLSRIFKAYDKDNSKRVTFAEWVAMKNYKLTDEQEKREKGWFDEADVNRDEKLTIGEWIDWKSNQGR